MTAMFIDAAAFTHRLAVIEAAVLQTHDNVNDLASRVFKLESNEHWMLEEMLERASTRLIEAVPDLLEIARFRARTAELKRKISDTKIGFFTKTLHIIEMLGIDLALHLPVQLFHSIEFVVIMLIISFIMDSFREGVFTLIDFTVDVVGCPGCADPADLYRSPKFPGQYTSVTWLANQITVGLLHIWQGLCDSTAFFQRLAGHRHPCASCMDDIPMINSDNWGAGWLAFSNTKEDCAAFSFKFYEFGTALKIVSSTMFCFLFPAHFSTYIGFDVVMFPSCHWSGFMKWCFTLYFSSVADMLASIRVLIAFVKAFQDSIHAIILLLESFILLMEYEKQLSKVQVRIEAAVAHLSGKKTPAEIKKLTRAQKKEAKLKAKQKARKEKETKEFIQKRSTL